MSFNPLQYLDPYVQEAREWAAGMHTDGMAMCHRIIAHLESIETAIRESDWDPTPAPFDRAYQDTNVTGDVVARVPRGTMWVLDTWNAVMVVGSAAVTLRGDGYIRGASTVGTTGMGTAGCVLARDTIFLPGETITLDVSSMDPGDSMQVFLQFRTRAIKARRRASSAGRRDPIPADVVNRNANAADVIARESQPGVTMVPHPASGSDRPSHGAGSLKSAVLNLKQ